MIVSEFIEWLKTQDQEAIVETLSSISSLGYGGDQIHVVDFIPEEHSEYKDFRESKWAVGTPYENQRFLLIGDK